MIASIKSRDQDRHQEDVYTRHWISVLSLNNHKGKKLKCNSFINICTNFQVSTHKKTRTCFWEKTYMFPKKHVRLFLRTKKRYPACRRIPLFIYLYRSRNQQRGLICLKKSLPLLSTKINAGKFSTSIFQIASIPNSGYSTHSMLLILF